jgi:hypothetical protein
MFIWCDCASFWHATKAYSYEHDINEQDDIINHVSVQTTQLLH